MKRFMRGFIILVFIIFITMIIPTLVYGQDGPKVTSDVPPDVFNYFVWSAGILIAGGSTALVMLWKSKKGLSTEERIWLKEIKKKLETNGGLSVEEREWLKLCVEQLKEQIHIDDIRDRLEKEQTDRRKQVEALYREQKEIMKAGMEANIKLETTLRETQAVLEKVIKLLKEKE